MDLRTALRKAELAFSIRCQAIGDLDGVRQRLGRLAVTAAAIAGLSASEARTVATSRPGNSVTIRRRSRSQTIVP
jgi:hypothetical protein